MKRFVFIAAFFFAALFPSFAGLSPRNPYNQGMVLQQNSSAAFKGFADAGAKVTVIPSWSKRKYTAIADSDGLWSVNLDTPSGGYQKYEISVKSGKDSYLVSDVLVGEVWFSSGQSNMEMPMAGWAVVRDVYEYVCGPRDDDRIRVFMGKLSQSFEPCSYTDGWWFKANAAEIPNMSAVSYFFARKLNEVLDVPVGVVCEAYGGTRVQAWIPQELLSTFEAVPSRSDIEASHHMSRPYMNYNAMIVPCIGYTVKGFLWYQGCSNVASGPESYKTLLTAMVDRWRHDWNDLNCDLPFYIVELAPYEYSYEWETGKAAAFRQGQWECAASIPNSAIVCTNDTVGEECRHDIHPANKKPVGDRLALLALNRQYGYSGLYCYPAVATAARFDFDHQVVLDISNGAGGLTNTDSIINMEVAGEDGVFYPVKAGCFSPESNTFAIWSDEVAKPVTVRYGWGDFAPGNVRTRFGEPLAPFNLSVSY